MTNRSAAEDLASEINALERFNFEGRNLPPSTLTDIIERACGQDGLTFAEFQSRNIDRASHAFPSQCLTPGFLGIAIAGEAGEMCNLVKKVLRGDFPIETQRIEILKEIADIMTYCDLFMSVLKADTANQITAKFEEVSARRGWKSQSVAPLRSCGETAWVTHDRWVSRANELEARLRSCEMELEGYRERAESSGGVDRPVDDNRPSEQADNPGTTGEDRENRR